MRFLVQRVRAALLTFWREEKGVVTVEWVALAGAVSAQGLNALPEQSAIPVPLGDSRENHIHVQW